MPIWRLFASAAVGSSIAAGFSIGTLLFAVRFLPGVRTPTFLPALHGHVQVFAFAVLMTIGVLYSFLPRLWGCPVPPAWRAWTAFALLFGGLLIVLVGVITAVRSLLAFGSVAEVTGAVFVVGEFASLLYRRGESRKGNDPALITALGSAALALPLAYSVSLLPTWQLSPAGVQASYVLAFYGVLVPVALAMSGRLFPLYFRTRLPARRSLALWIALEVVGLYVRLGGVAFAWNGGVRLGCALQATGILGAIVALRMLEPREKRAASARVLWRDPTAWLVHIAYLSLALCALALLRAVWPGWMPPQSLEWHLLGVGYVTCLIAGVGAHLLPGFARQRPRSQYASWVVLISLTGALVLRLWAVLARGSSVAVSGAAAGVLGLAAMVVFAWNAGLSSLRQLTK
ncbi:NnrS family protein [Thermomicrobium sp. 4228-Ro]|uniref:NnrS family protein n=1 Tax=Thermomicrobium sp. 4228-Ro TaxID=2993937 RepID=UPI00224880BE|nr:NnrS family protein [Thermomicrobium sp. 4228-Ro]MCX2726336.1 NnrS family protein [Thermomicrobium sp. 4228-Ro]